MCVYVYTFVTVESESEEWFVYVAANSLYTRDAYLGSREGGKEGGKEGKGWLGWISEPAISIHMGHRRISYRIDEGDLQRYYRIAW